MGWNLTETELPLLMLATDSLEKEEKENKKLEGNSIFQFPPCPKKKRSVLDFKKGVMMKPFSFDHQEKLSQKFSNISEGDSIFKNWFNQENQEGLIMEENQEMEAIEEKGFKKRRVSFCSLPLEASNSSCTERKRSILEDGKKGVQEESRLMEELSSKNCFDDEKEGVQKKQKLSIMVEKTASDYDHFPNPPPRLPEKFKNMISTLTGEGREISMEKLVIQKKLEWSDLNQFQNRFSIPMGESNYDFLDENEKGKSCHLVPIVDPSLNVYEIKLSLYKLYYALNGVNWKAIRETNGLESGMILQLWAVRAGNDLWFALVNVTENAVKGIDHKESVVVKRTLSRKGQNNLSYNLKNMEDID